MPDTGSLVEVDSTIAQIAAARRDGRHGSQGLRQAAERDLLLYMQDLLRELEALAVGANLEGLAELLAFASRETERTRKQLS